MSTILDRTLTIKINQGRLGEELRALGHGGISIAWSGYHKLDDRTVEPNAARTQIGSTNGVPMFADPGELKITFTSVDLTAPQIAQVDAIFTNHDFTQISAEQGRVDKDDVDKIRLETLFKLGWLNLTDAQRVEATGLTTRLLLRREIRGAF